jgi:hypothetical protein
MPGIDAFALRSARAMQPLKVRFFDEKVEDQNRNLEKSRNDEPGE